MADNYLYVVFSTTPFKIGKFIRLITGYNYNHVSISLTKDLKKMYSFSRYFKNAPLHGGFTEESILRYENKGKSAKIKICAIPVDENGINQICAILENMNNNHSQYNYNIISALFSLFKKRAIIPYSYTCTEFVAELLSNFKNSFDIDAQKYYSIKEFDKIFENYKIYEGSVIPYSENADWGNDLFLNKKRISEITFLTAISYWTVLKLYLTN